MTIIGLVLIWLLMVAPLLNWKSSLSAGTERSYKQLVRLSSLRQNADLWSAAQAQATDAVKQQKQVFFTGSSDSSVQIKVQARLRQYCVTHEVAVESQKFLPVRLVQGLGHEFSVAMTINGDVLPVLRVLDDISRSPKLLIVKRWVTNVERNGKMRAQLVVAGYRAANVGANDES